MVIIEFKQINLIKLYGNSEKKMHIFLENID